MEAYQFLRHRQLIPPNVSLQETAMPNLTWGELIQLLDDYLKSKTAKAIGVDALVIKADPQACAAAEEISKTLTKQQLSFKEKLIISLAGNDKYVLMKEIDRDRVKGIVYKDFDYEETAKTIIKQAEKIIEIMEA